MAGESRTDGIDLDLPRDRQARAERGRRRGGRRRRRQARHPAQHGERGRLVFARGRPRPGSPGRSTTSEPPPPATASALGDVNGDGRPDLLTPKGWFEAPSDPTTKAETWAWHPEWNLGSTGIQILARDVDGDGLSDLIYGSGHAFGLFWRKQGKGEKGERTWIQSTIDPKLSSVHTLLWADLDGDGKPNELITGKRVYAHEVEPGEVEAPVIAYFTFDPAAGKWDPPRHLPGPTRQGRPQGRFAARRPEVDFPPGTAGTGLKISAIDIDEDGDIDLVCPGKSGLYLFENLDQIEIQVTAHLVPIALAGLEPSAEDGPDESDDPPLRPRPRTRPAPQAGRSTSPRDRPSSTSRPPSPGPVPTLGPLLPSCRIAINAEYAVDDRQTIPPGAEVAAIPPVSGGSSTDR